MLQIEDFRSQTWKRLTQELRDRLQSLREMNDAQSNDERRTAVIRGQITEVKRMLSLCDEHSDGTEASTADEAV